MCIVKTLPSIYCSHTPGKKKSFHEFIAATLLGRKFEVDFVPQWNCGGGSEKHTNMCIVKTLPQICCSHTPGKKVRSWLRASVKLWRRLWETQSQSIVTPHVFLNEIRLCVATIMDAALLVLFMSTYICRQPRWHRGRPQMQGVLRLYFTSSTLCFPMALAIDNLNS